MMCLKHNSNIIKLFTEPFPLDTLVGAHPLASLAQQFQDLRKDAGKKHLKEEFFDLMNSAQVFTDQTDSEEHELEDPANLGRTEDITVAHCKEEGVKSCFYFYKT